nr:tryptophan--tRNA ligase [Nesterenkonia ebinurensis]
MAERVLSGMQPTGDSLHLGNYVGALLNWVRMQEQHDAYFMIVDLHAITMPQDPAALREATRRTAAQYIAGGIDPDRSTPFVQSHVPEHAQLAWVLMTQTGMGEAARMTQFKDKSAKEGSEHAGVGLFTYPILQAADILLYQPYGVPVGEDQKQHIELTRDLAQRFNHRFGETFRIPKPLIPEQGARIYDLQDPTAKMSKSASSPNGVLLLTDTDKKIAKKIKSAVTDDGAEIRYDPAVKPGISSLLSIYSVLGGKSIPELEAEYADKMYGHLKVDLAELAVATLGPVRDRTAELLNDPGELDTLLAKGAAKARETASSTLAEVYQKVGFLPAAGG